MMMNGETQMEMVSNMANALILLSKSNYNNSARKRFFKCKTCDKEFSSFQALGGHRASHKKPAALDGFAAAVSAVKPKSKTHECSICGAAFGIGQALGGHMRRHRSIIHMTGGIGATAAGKAVGIFLGPVMMKKSSGNGNSKRVLCLDLNLTPLENDDLKLELGRMAS